MAARWGHRPPAETAAASGDLSRLQHPPLAVRRSGPNVLAPRQRTESANHASDQRAWWSVIPQMRDLAVNPAGRDGVPAPAACRGCGQTIECRISGPRRPEALPVLHAAAVGIPLGRTRPTSRRPSGGRRHARRQARAAHCRIDSTFVLRTERFVGRRPPRGSRSSRRSASGRGGRSSARRRQPVSRRGAWSAPDRDPNVADHLSRSPRRHYHPHSLPVGDDVVSQEFLPLSLTRSPPHPPWRVAPYPSLFRRSVATHESCRIDKSVPPKSPQGPVWLTGWRGRTESRCRWRQRRGGRRTSVAATPSPWWWRDGCR